MDEDCLLASVVDSEVVVRQVNSSVPDIINTLLSLDRSFLKNTEFKMYNIYNGVENLMFKVRDTRTGGGHNHRVTLINHLLNSLAGFEYRIGICPIPTA